jgi:hypothetical protein
MRFVLKRFVLKLAMMLAVVGWGIGCDSPASSPDPDPAPGADPMGPGPEIPQPGGTGETLPDSQQPGTTENSDTGLNSSPENPLTPANPDLEPNRP